MSPHNSLRDAKLPIESDTHENSSPNVESIENNPSARNAKKSGALNASQDTQLLEHDYDTVLDMIGAKLSRVVVAFIFNIFFFYLPTRIWPHAMGTADHLRLALDDGH